MFTKIMVANRGEIAVRILRACREMKIQTVAIYSEADRNSLHVRYADEAYCVGPAPSIESYLNQKKIIKTAKEVGVQAIHPGYGFLAENSGFAKFCEDEGIVFIGPHYSAIEAMGSKTFARQKMMNANVPTVPGTSQPIESDEEIERIADDIGYPVMIKASAGGGGKGMRLVKKKEDIKGSIRAAKSEAKSAFGDSSVYIEKFIETSRHIEFQVLGDKYGNLIHLNERECSIQRRHQKVIEESPSPIVDPEMRKKMGAAAVSAAKAVNYYSAGTVEFLVDKNKNFHFLEMNTRLQVEHPVTEMTTGIDIVKEMIKIAAGENLSIRQENVELRGACIECRIYAEDPDNNFLPFPGKICELRTPGGPGVRDDSGVFEGYVVPIYYDPMISKLAVWGKDRNEAIEKMSRALTEYSIKGIKTTIPFHERVMKNKHFINGDFDTNFIDTKFNIKEKTDKNNSNKEIALISAVLWAFNEEKEKIKNSKAVNNKKVSGFNPWKGR
ncbi:MAG: acetyl-CoA carboxylase biotin carboxylase subunit [Candidatus Schekmanbacteria bacterium RIFCSPHIGHO2_02_FULL_38_11]|uniref:Acetyl-CoA carboxylase biotin carboxylase subunit n=1 Tax=Candidatus Schekmanbacteria bacterium RIFCSPLOWO2_12_FULL_38_15 TaxID=1817883 RepID=A0A1F7SHW2_9BACT|nr:MAG: acetyl-CoA carboxylase biotin carboxylase subunit [Candidatus Schekmanbacteria bacterium GWA2_38_9]OGL50844.1 MAG: acetyl-CoA carboxylase biotin carboxylase subunit [Candidatus Schekmanbacteria bacterium RIFCSPLOWO2_02_FULL_38_14]OGL53396.1 MAG: acetyl-CoA carboxylase biotin carboxylase subunit [Candidatus Schekmanbacteria bacterium RIFCSPLOWO2_12_FULL_38_15]OGL55748.1 MAG: acetyl-CoA carboxylase biotin carboxylase subunit [Candidatus Schekmanbacteria bacterium RIFCSPHIGHO2_02_FULL_38_11